MSERTRTELLRIIEEMKSERDAAKTDTLRAIEERNRALDEAATLRVMLRDHCQTCSGTGVVMGNTPINETCQYDCPDCAGENP